MIAAQKSAEGIVAAECGEGPNDGRASQAVSSCVQSGRTTSWSWPLSRAGGVKPRGALVKGVFFRIVVAYYNMTRPGFYLL